MPLASNDESNDELAYAHSNPATNKMLANLLDPGSRAWEPANEPFAGRTLNLLTPAPIAPAASPRAQEYPPMLCNAMFETSN